MRSSPPEADGSWSGTAEPTAVTFKPDASNAAEGKAFYGIDKSAPSNPAAITTDDADNGKLKAVEIPVPEGSANYIGFKFSGVVNDHPDKAWVAGDTLGAVVAFTFKPMSNISAS